MDEKDKWSRSLLILKMAVLIYYDDERFHIAIHPPDLPSRF